MTDLAKTIAPKSDQLNADDLIAGPITVTITGVRGCDDADQPVAINFEGDGGKPYKPCKSMRRVMVHCWGADGKTYTGRRLTLYRDEKVAFGGIQVGGTRISHMSHIDREMVLALTVTRAKRAPYKVLPLKADVRRAPAATQRRDEATSSDEPHKETYAGGFGGQNSADGGAPETDEHLSAAVLWMRGVMEDLDGDAFRSTADLDAFFADAENQRQFAALEAEDASLAVKLNAALRGRGKALASRR